MVLGRALVVMVAAAMFVAPANATRLLPLSPLDQATAQALPAALAPVATGNPADSAGQTGGALVPEPENWAMLVVGLFFVGLIIRRRPRTVSS